MTRTAAEDALLAKARRGAPITIEDKLSVIGRAADVDWFREGLRDFGLDTPEALAACARRKVDLQRGAV